MSKFSKIGIGTQTKETFPSRNVGVILAGGPGKRLLPLTKTINKHLLSVGVYPMVYHPIIDMVKMGVTDLFLVTGHEHIGGFTEHLGDGSRFGISITYVVQEEPNGIGGALGLVVDRLTSLFYTASLHSTHNSLSTSRLIVMLGDNIFNHDKLHDRVELALSKNSTVDLFIKIAKDNNRFGVPEFNSFNELIKVTEKPKHPTTHYAMTGLYIFKMNLVLGLMKDFMNSDSYKKSDRGEYEITDILNWVAMKSETIYWIRVQCHKIGKTYWSDAGTFESLQKSNRYMRDYRFWASLD